MNLRISRSVNCTVLSVLLGVAILLPSCVTPKTLRHAIDEERLREEERKQRTVAMQSLLFDEIRVNRVSYPLLEAALPYTGKPARPFLGIYFANKYTFSKIYRDTAEELYGVDQELTVLDIIPESPADKCGLLPGDALIRINGEQLPVGPDAPAEIDDFFDRHLIPETAILLTVSRDEGLVDLEVVPAGIANYHLILSGKQTVNARATGNKIIINRGLLRFAETDNELAIVISHEIAHNVMKHIRAVLANYTLGTLVDVVANSLGIITGNSVGAAAAYSQVQAFETEADYVGLYIMALAEMPIEDAPEFWRRMATVYPGIIRKRILSTHPPSPERSVALEETIKEIHEKKHSGTPLIPELRLKSKQH